MRIENRVWVAIVIIPGIPFIPSTSARSVRHNAPGAAPDQRSAARRHGLVQRLHHAQQQSALVPVWWFFMHAISKAVTGAAVAAIPAERTCARCAWTWMPRIDDPVLAQGRRLRARLLRPSSPLFMTGRRSPDDQMNDVTWIGSSYFQARSGFYDTYLLFTPRTAWPLRRDPRCGPSGG